MCLYADAVAIHDGVVVIEEEEEEEEEYDRLSLSD